jgi:sulfite reductase (NADPH) flavoprotein alpha-component
MIHILFGTQTGNAQNLAQVIGDSLRDDFPVEIHDMGRVDPEEIFNMKILVLVTSTYGDGEVPDNASEWMSFLKFSDDLKLDHLHYAVVGLGDPYYPHFCQAGKDFDQYLSDRGGKALLPRLDCDRYYEEQYQEWLKELKTVLKTKLPD